MGWIECALFKSHHSISRWVGHGGMDAALRALHQGNVDISVLLEEYMTGGIHMQYIAGYMVWATEAESHQIVGITIIWIEDTGWQVEGVTKYITNVVSFMITVVRKCWFIVGAYMPPNDQSAVHWVEQALAQVLEGTETLMVSNINSHLAQPHDRYEGDLATVVANYSL